MIKNLPANAGDLRDAGFWQPTPVFLPRKFNGQRSLVGYSPYGHKESDLTRHTCVYTHTHTYTRIIVIIKTKT